MKQYTIGNVSKRLGISRDTLRFYEKKGIITPQKLDNGYRCYTYEDTRKLLDIMFYRRIGFSIEDISRILHQSSYGSYYTMIQEKIAEEERRVEHHRQLLIHLKYLKQLYKNIGDFLDAYDIRPLRRYYKMDESNLIDKPEVFDLCYIYQEYEIGEEFPRQVDEYFLIAADTAAITGIEPSLEGHLFVLHERCVYTVTASKSRIPDESSILKAACWAKNQGYSLVGTAYSGFLLGCAVDESQAAVKEEAKGQKPVYYIELYLPLVN